MQRAFFKPKVKQVGVANHSLTVIPPVATAIPSVLLFYVDLIDGLAQLVAGRAMDEQKTALQRLGSRFTAILLAIAALLVVLEFVLHRHGEGS